VEGDRVKSGKVIWSVTMSLDGFIAGADNNMEWVFQYAEPNPLVDEVIRTTGAILAGRNSYEVGQRAQRPELREVFGGGWHGPQFVLTHTAHAEDPANIFLSGDIRQAVDTALEAAGGKNVNVIGADVARQCLEAGLIDEIVVFLAPLLLGEGVRLFSAANGAPVKLETISVTQSGRVGNLRYRVAR
jgi:dihydrofolate reductase